MTFAMYHLHHSLLLLLLLLPFFFVGPCNKAGRSRLQAGAGRRDEGDCDFEVPQ